MPFLFDWPKLEVWPERSRYTPTLVGSPPAVPPPRRSQLVLRNIAATNPRAIKVRLIFYLARSLVSLKLGNGRLKQRARSSSARGTTLRDTRLFSWLYS